MQYLQRAGGWCRVDCECWGVKFCYYIWVLCYGSKLWLVTQVMIEQHNHNNERYSWSQSMRG